MGKGFRGGSLGKGIEFREIGFREIGFRVWGLEFGV